MAGKTTRVWDVLGIAASAASPRREARSPPTAGISSGSSTSRSSSGTRSRGRFFARHHPFTSPRLEDVDKLESDPGATLARAYDVVMNGLELGGGSIRINTPELQSRMFRALGISDDDARERFGFLLDAFRYGAPPHGGVALGFDRMVMLMARAESLREVIAFPKTARAQDLMSEAPSTVDEKQLDELGIRVCKG